MKVLRDATRPARRALAKRIFNFPENWDHVAAQRYELTAARHFIREAFPRNYAAWQAQPDDGMFFNRDDQWFCGNTDLFAKFRAHITDKTCLEIGSGPFGHLGQSKAFNRRVVIDPLLDAYREIELEEHGTTFFTPDIQGYSVAAETRVSELVGKIDGLIVCRNCLDHCDDPLTVLGNIASYATAGCWLFLWTDIWHVQGHDEGHRNITRSQSVVRALLDGLAFDVIQEGRSIGDSAECIEFGCIARKR